MNRMLRKFAGAAMALSWMAALAGTIQGSPAPGANEFEWRFSITQGGTASSNITVNNTCSRKHKFEIAADRLPSFLRLLGTSRLEVDARRQAEVPVKFDSNGLPPGLHEGLVVIRCATCRQTPDCNLDYTLLHIYMNVEAPNVDRAKQAPPATALHTAPQVAEFAPGRVLAVIPLYGPGDETVTARKLASDYGLELVELHRLESIKAALASYRLKEGVDVQAKAAALLPHVLFAQPDFIYRTAAPGGQEGGIEYGTRMIHADRLRGTANGKGVKVAVIDTGIDVKHPALQGKVTGQADMTGMGYSADIHGTLVAGIIGAARANTAQINSVAPGADIAGIKACQPVQPGAIEAQCWSLTLSRGVDYAIQKNAQVINMSVSGPADRLLKQLIETAAARGITVVAAAGNDGPEGKPGFPAALPGVIAVTAVDAKQRPYTFATQGDYIRVAAPGVEILSTSPGGRVSVSSGTSMATAFVSGVAALMLQQNPRLTPGALQALLERTAQDLGPPGKDRQFGYGLVDACRAVAELKSDKNLCR